MLVDGGCGNKTDAKHLADNFTLDLASAVPASPPCLVRRDWAVDYKMSVAPARIRPSWHLSAMLKANHRAPLPRPQLRAFRRGEFR
jgi:hypothetical protein